MAQCVLRIAQLSENCVGVSITRVCFGYLSLCWESSTALCRSDDNVSLLRLFGPVFGIKHRMLYKSDNNGGNSRACCVHGRDNDASMFRLFGPVLGIEHRMSYRRDNEGDELSVYCVERNNNAILFRLFGPVLGIERWVLYKSDNNGGKLRACCVEGAITRVCS